jgi:hypothetical protein
MERKDFPSRFPRLPLPEMAGSDRDEPHCLPGFVDRAYLVFLSNYGPQLLAASSDCSKTDPSSSHPLRVFAADSFGVRGGVRAPDDPSPTRASSIQTAAGRLRRPRAPTEVPIRAQASHHLSPLFPWEGPTPQPCSPTGLRPRIRPWRSAWLVPIRGVASRARREERNRLHVNGIAVGPGFESCGAGTSGRPSVTGRRNSDGPGVPGPCHCGAMGKADCFAAVTG